jgi:hypothetical protein
MTFSFPGNRAVRLAAGFRCPACDRVLSASAVEIDDLGVGLTCPRCHHTLLTIEKR